MGPNTIKIMKLCFPFERYLQEKTVASHLKSEVHSKKIGVKILCQIWKHLLGEQNNQAHLQSQECIRKKTLEKKSHEEHNNTKKKI